ncbi:MAG: FAD-binding oxidoreductase [Vallitalea sp.]|nr:FAD-binding oxidoreductase [Vallitalea sp.]
MNMIQLISQMDKGQETLMDVKISRKNGKYNLCQKNKTKDKVSELHPDRLNLKVTDIREVTSDSKVFRFVSENVYLPPFQAGQYINVFTEIDGVRTSRPYSISSSPKQRSYYEITVARIPNGFVSDYFLDEVKVGDTFEGKGPAGNFYYNPLFHLNNQVFLAGGSGVTPFMSMIREILETGLGREVYLIYGSRNESATLYHNELIKLDKTYSNFHYTLVVSDKPETSDYVGRVGFIDAKCIKEIVNDIDDCTYYLCGPQLMYDFCLKEMGSLNIPAKRIRREVFGARQDIQNEPGWPKELSGEEVFKLKVGDKIIDAKSNEPILTSLERAGIKINVCCRSGECSLCRVKLVSGRVFQPRGVLLRLADEKFGYIHSCKSYPMGDVEILI